MKKLLQIPLMLSLISSVPGCAILDWMIPIQEPQMRPQPQLPPTPTLHSIYVNVQDGICIDARDTAELLNYINQLERIIQDI